MKNALKTITLISLAAAISWVASSYFGFNAVDLTNAAYAAASPKSTLFVGDSVIKATSKCDKDKRSIADLYTAITKNGNNDLSRGGMRLDEEIEIAKVNADNTSPDITFIPLSVTTHLLAAREQLIGRDAWIKLNIHKRENKIDLEALEYKGTRYGDYATFSKTHFPAEQSAQNCANTAIANPDFVEFMYWRNFIRDPDFDSGAEQWKPELEKVKALTGRLILVVMPYNHQTVSKLFGERETTRINQSIQGVLSFLKSSGFEALDLSTTLNTADFTDIYCACGHLNENGRAKIAQSISRYIQQK